MKLLKKLGIICLTILMSACSSDDDAIGGLLGGLDVTTLLTSGKWYQEARTPDGLSACEKNTNVEFTITGAVFIESFDDETGPCESTGLETGVFTITNDRDVVITSENVLISIVIDLITLDVLIVTTDEGETLTFDKVQG